MPLTEANLLQQSYDTLGQARSNAMPNPSIINTASDRLASRIAAKQKGDLRSLQNRYAGMGRAGSGGYQQNYTRTVGDNTNALAGGLADLNEQFENSRLQGAQTLAGIGGNYRDLYQTQGTLGLEKQALNQKKETDRVQNLLDFFGVFIEGGNLDAGARDPGRDEMFDTQLKKIISELFRGTT